MIARDSNSKRELSLLKRIIGKIRMEPCSDPALEGDCWIWEGATNSKGYPMVWHAGTVVGAHVASHRLFIGEPEPGHHVHHKCMNKCCVNPKHLADVTPEANRTMQTMGVGTLPDEIDLRIDEVPF